MLLKVLLTGASGAAVLAPVGEPATRSSIPVPFRVWKDAFTSWTAFVARRNVDIGTHLLAKSLTLASVHLRSPPRTACTAIELKPVRQFHVLTEFADGLLDATVRTPLCGPV
jgi:hypothetical protein